MSEINIRGPIQPKSRFYNLDPDIRIIILAILVGIIGGLGAIVFRMMIDGVNYLLVEGPNTLIENYISKKYTAIVTVAAPAIGGLIVGALIYYFAREAKGHGVPEIVEAVNHHKGHMRIRVPFVKIIASAVTIGTTGSAGREGPIAQIGGGFASVLSQRLNLNAEETKILVVSGVSAGIAATFNAPLGGVLFGLEIIRRDKRSFPILPLVTSSVVGTAIGEFFLGTSPAFIFPTGASYLHIINVPIFIFLGILMGVASVIWTKGFYWMEDLLEKIPTTPILLAGLGGLGVGIMELWYPEMSGISYAAIDDAFALKLSLQIVIVLALLKFIATALTIGSGGSGGVFAPTLFIGVMLGTGIGRLMDSTGFIGLSIPVIALLCMAALFAGSARAPLTAVVMTSEMVNDFQLIIPLMFAVLSAWVVSKALMEDDIYIIKLKRRGLEFTSSIDVLEDIPVSSIMIKDPVYVSSKDRLETVIDLMKRSGHTGFPVVDNNHLVGIITEHDVTKGVDTTSLDDWVVGDLCSKNVITVVRSCPVSTVMLTMSKQNINRMPVISSKKDHRLVGWVTRSDVMNAYFSAKANKRHEEAERELFENLEDGSVELDSK
ncbi:MAG: CBS domain-containing protein [Candidatus Heimdallarchaeota archaeon]|nr:CBS domain-containing protein [Candidatus Heimdallarchaeota archaeon]